MGFLGTWIIAAALQMGVAHGEAREEVLALQKTIHAADRGGDFEGAVRAAEDCVTISATDPNRPPGNPYCVMYLSSALRTGRGVARDEGRAFRLLKAIVAEDPDDEAALDLAEDYLDGVGTARDPIEGAVIFWRTQHGAWSFYSDHWGMCDECQSFFVHEKAVGERVAREVSPDQLRQSAIIAASRFPEIEARVALRRRQITIGAGSVLLAIVGAYGWYARFRKRAAS